MAMSKESKIWTLNDVSDCILLVVLSQFEKIEDIVSKERISSGFRRAADLILMKKKGLNIEITPKYSINSEHVLNLVKRMPKLIRIDCFRDNLPKGFGNVYKFISRVATINQNIEKFIVPYPALSTHYVECVKKLNAIYDAANFKTVFDYDYEECLLEYPDLKLKVQIGRRDVEECSHKHLINQLDLHSDDTIKEPLPSVETVVLGLDKPPENLNQNLRFLRNVKEFILQTYIGFDMTKFNQVLDAVNNRFLEHLEITCYGEPEADYSTRIKAFIRCKPLIRVAIETDDQNNELFHRLVNMLLHVQNVHGHHLKKIEVADGRYEKEDGEGYSVCYNRSLIVGEKVIRYEDYTTEQVKDVNFLLQVVTLYPKVKNIEIKLKDPIANVDGIIRVCEGICDANRKRIVKLTTMHPTIDDKVINTRIF